MIASSLWSMALLDWHICISFVVSGLWTNLTVLLPSLRLIFKMQFSYIIHIRLGRLVNPLD